MKPTDDSPSDGPPLGVWAATLALLLLVAVAAFVGVVWFDVDPLALLA